MEKIEQHTDIEQVYTSAFISYLELFSSVTTESVYVLDIPRQQFCFVKPDDLFLCGYSVEEALREEFNFYTKIIYPEDLPLWMDMYKVVLRYFLNGFAENRDEIDCFSCTFRLQRSYSFMPSRPLPQMIYQRMKPVWEDKGLRYLICSVKSSTIKETGNLRMHNKDGSTYEYNPTARRWLWKTKELLTEREKAILMLAEQGKCVREIADDLCKGQNTIQNQIKPLFLKLNAHSMQEAIELTRHYRIYTK